MPTIELNAGKIHYEESGPADGRPLVFVHGLAMAASIWRPLTDRLASGGLRCIAPTWPLGAHEEPVKDGSALTMEGVAAMVAETLDALDLADVVLVGNDTGGAIAQVVAVSAPGRIGALALTSCDAFEHFPPAILKPLQLAAKSALTFRAALQPLRAHAGRKQVYGPLAHADIDELVLEWTKPALSDAAITEDLRRFTASLDQRTTVAAAAALPGFSKPSLVAWSADDAFFPVEDGRKLARTLPNCRFELIERSRTFSMIDRPEALADLIAELAARGVDVQAAAAAS